LLSKLTFLFAVGTAVAFIVIFAVDRLQFAQDWIMSNNYTIILWITLVGGFYFLEEIWYKRRRARP
jgi:hypothetical protein